MRTVLTFDVGKTTCRACLFSDGVRVGQAHRPGSPGIADPGGTAAALASMAEVAHDIGADRVDAIGAGLAGFGAAEDACDKIARALAQRHGTGTVALASDMTIAHAGALAGGDGVVVAAGTGSVALGLAANGSRASVDGWGFLLGDDGSAYAIGRAGLASALREYDGRGGSAELAARATNHFGTVARLPSIVHGSRNPATTIAAFATEVCAAAADGDPIAARICSRAGSELARMAAAAAARTSQAGESYELAVTGGIFESENAVWQAFSSDITTSTPPPKLSVRQGDGCDGAHLIVMREDLPHEQLVSRPEVQL